jgi:hypothetical protein
MRTQIALIGQRIFFKTGCGMPEGEKPLFLAKSCEFSPTDTDVNSGVPVRQVSDNLCQERERPEKDPLFLPGHIKILRRYHVHHPSGQDADSSGFCAKNEVFCPPHK